MSEGRPVSGKAVKSATSPAPKGCKLKAHVYGMPGTVLASSGVSRRLDFSKDRISKALSVVRSKREGTQLWLCMLAWKRFTFLSEGVS